MKRWRIKFHRNEVHDPVVLISGFPYIVEQHTEHECYIFDLAGNKLVDPDWTIFDIADDFWSLEYINRNSVLDHSPFDNALDKLLGDDDESV